MSETLTTDITTIIEVGNVIRFRTPLRGIAIHGTVTGIIRYHQEPWLTVNRRVDGKQMVVAMDEVLKVCKASAGVPPVPVVEVPVVPKEMIMPETAKAPRTVLARIGDTVRFVHPAFETRFLGVVQEADTTGVLVEMPNGELVDIPQTDVLAIVRAA